MRGETSAIQTSTEPSKDLVWSPDLNQVQSNTSGYDAVKGTRPYTDWNVVTTRANDPRSRYDGLGLELNKRLSAGLSSERLVHAGAASVRRRRRRSHGVRRRERRDDARFVPRRCRLRERRLHAPAPVRQHVPLRVAVRPQPAHWRNGIGRGMDALVGGWDLTGVTLAPVRPLLDAVVQQRRPLGDRDDRAGFTATQRPDQVRDGTSRGSDGRSATSMPRRSSAPQTTSGGSGTRGWASSWGQAPASSR